MNSLDKEELMRNLEYVRCILMHEILSQVAAVTHPGDSDNVFENVFFSRMPNRNIFSLVRSCAALVCKEGCDVLRIHAQTGPDQLNPERPLATRSTCIHFHGHESMNSLSRLSRILFDFDAVYIYHQGDPCSNDM
jgi:hypothetical protein